MVSSNTSNTEAPLWFQDWKEKEFLPLLAEVQALRVTVNKNENSRLLDGTMFPFEIVPLAHYQVGPTQRRLLYVVLKLSLQLELTLTPIQHNLPALLTVDILVGLSEEDVAAYCKGYGIPLEEIQLTRPRVTGQDMLERRIGTRCDTTVSRWIFQDFDGLIPQLPLTWNNLTHLTFQTMGRYKFVGLSPKVALEILQRCPRIISFKSNIRNFLDGTSSLPGVDAPTNTPALNTTDDATVQRLFAFFAQDRQPPILPLLTEMDLQMCREHDETGVLDVAQNLLHRDGSRFQRFKIEYDGWKPPTSPEILADFAAQEDNWTEFAEFPIIRASWAQSSRRLVRTVAGQNIPQIRQLPENINAKQTPPKVASPLALDLHHLPASPSLPLSEPSLLISPLQPCLFSEDTCFAFRRTFNDVVTGSLTPPKNDFFLRHIPPDYIQVWERPSSSDLRPGTMWERARQWNHPLSSGAGTIRFNSDLGSIPVATSTDSDAQSLDGVTFCAPRLLSSVHRPLLRLGRRSTVQRQQDTLPCGTGGTLGSEIVEEGVD
ncbi:hypothetical protein C8R47DRAFT_1214270 [Mycena vitilis]|nr:hypothetical protein C8R47DRAFT_1214270 [Mycena vitilis]